MEGDGAVAAAGHALLHRVEDVFLVPEVIRHVAGYQVVLGNKGEDPAPPQRVSEEIKMKILKFSDHYSTLVYLESPAFTPRPSMHFPISTSSAPPSSVLQVIPVLSWRPFVTNLRSASLERT